MGIFQKVSGWLADKGDRFIRGESDHEGGYYATQEAREAYSSAAAQQDPTDEAGETTEHRQPLDPFGRGEGEYGGRVPYRSKYERDMEAYQQAQQQQAPARQPDPRQNVPPQQAAAPNPASGAGYAAPRQGMTGQTAYPQGFAPPYNNVVPFPGMQRGPDGLVYAHVEYIVLLRSRNECKDVIGYIKTSASVFLNMEFIASDSERQRCVDMLSGAAYTLGCALNKISPRGIYLISSPTVKVVLDPAMQKFAAAPEAQGFVRQRYDQDPYHAYGEAPQPSYEQPGQTSPAAYDPPMQQRSAVGYEPSMQQQRMSFGTESPTARFQAQGTQRTMPISFSSAMAGSRTGSFPAQGGTGRYRAVEYPQ